MAALLLYVLAFLLLYPPMGSSVASLALIPVLLCGWVAGRMAGLLAGLLAIVLNTLLFNLSGEPGWDVVFSMGGGPGSLAVLMAGAGAGWAHSLQRRYEREMVAHRQAAAALRQSERHFRTLFEESPIGKDLVDATGRFLRVNARLCEMLGYSAEELQRLTFADVTHPDDLERDLAQAQRVAAGEIPRYQMEKRFVRKDGSLLWVNLTVTAIRDELSGAQLFLGMVEDIDERKQVELALQRRNHELQLLNRVVGAATSRLEPVVVLETVCRELAQAFHLPQAGAALLTDDGQALEVVAQYVSGDRRTGVGERIPLEGNAASRQVLRTREPLVIDDARHDPRMTPVHRLMRERDVASIMLLPLVVEGEVVGTLGLDANHPHHFSDEEVRLAATAAAAASQVLDKARLLQRTRQQAAQLETYAAELARSNEELQQFAYIASHDLQEPLRMVTSFLQLLQQRYEGRLDDKADEYIYYAVDGATRMKRLIDDLLRYSRIATRGMPLVPVDSGQVVDTVLNDLQLAVQESDATVTASSLPPVLGDEIQLRQLFQNLIGNALKFHGAEPPQIELAAEHRNGHWQFAVRDHGIGIDPAHAERIFVIFKRLHTGREYEGMGIGLAVCKRIVERHGGTIWLESAPGEGSTFYFTLPAVG